MQWTNYKKEEFLNGRELQRGGDGLLIYCIKNREAI